MAKRRMMTSKQANACISDADVAELEHLERVIQFEARHGDFFEPESLEDEGIERTASPRAIELMRRRERLIERVRPQCVDPNDDALTREAERAAKDEFGMEDGSWDFPLQCDTKG